ncbi:MAG: glucosaminidase domain-containing protein, partial [Bacteroidota bacterium]
MKTKLFILGLFLTQLVTAQDNLRFLAYIDTYKEIAIQEMERAGIPASIKLAQGLLESSAGRSKLATEANNHFGIKCGGSWRGGTYYHNDDDYNDKGELIPSCFRMYRDATQSYRAHSEFLRNPSKAFRYGRLFRLKVKDYKRWARGLKDAGYATAENYDEKLIDLIERYELYKYDRMSVEEAAEEEWIVVDEEVRERPKPLKEFEVLETNDVKYVVSTSEEDLAAIAERTAISLKYLQKYNEGLTDGTISPGTRVFIQPKRNTYRGREMWHKVQKGETMYSISQLYGLKLERLYERNRMEEEMEPAVGEQIKLRGRKAKKTPKLFVEEVAAVAETLAAPEVLELEEPASEEPTEEEPVVEKPIAEEPA